MAATGALSDAQLVVLLAGGEEGALAEIYRRHGGVVFGLARRVLGVAEDAEDVTQEVFLALWNRPERFDPGRGSLRTFLLTTAHSRAVDTLRARSARAAREAREALSEAATADLDRELDDLVLADRITEAVAALGDGERKAIELAYFGGHTYREVAVILAEPEGTIKTRIRSGLRRLRSALTGDLYEGEVGGR